VTPDIESWTLSNAEPLQHPMSDCFRLRHHRMRPFDMSDRVVNLAKRAAALANNPARIAAHAGTGPAFEHTCRQLRPDLLCGHAHLFESCLRAVANWDRGPRLFSGMVTHGTVLCTADAFSPGTARPPPPSLELHLDQCSPGSWEMAAQHAHGVDAVLAPDQPGRYALSLALCALAVALRHCAAGQRVELHLYRALREPDGQGPSRRLTALFVQELERSLRVAHDLAELTLSARAGCLVADDEARLRRAGVAGWEERALLVLAGGRAGSESPLARLPTALLLLITRFIGHRTRVRVVAEPPVGHPPTHYDEHGGALVGSPPAGAGAAGPVHHAAADLGMVALHV
jgi:hypothetical protein